MIIFMNKKVKWKVTHEDGLTKISEQELNHETEEVIPEDDRFDEGF